MSSHLRNGRPPDPAGIASGSSERQRVHQPADRTSATARNPPNISPPSPHLLARIVAQQRGEHRRNQEREQTRSRGEWSRPIRQRRWRRHLRPIATSNASRMTRKFSSPATMRKRVAVLVGHGRHRPRAGAGHRGERPTAARCPSRRCAARTTSGSDIEREHPALEQQSDPEHRQQHDEEHDRLLRRPEPEMAGARHEPGGNAHQRQHPGSADARGSRPW